ncbi:MULTISPECIES: hypothetical protein [Enterobacter]|uniref:hypothetical protein n=1 Tax=Enterobacter TaxID=547 RepID=UPI0007E50E25|nr:MULTISPECIES: hypothetical protein [Enterobacter]MCS3488153.1 hypothetical protein [Enterobacter sp. SLBN-59]OAY17835.1 hypothetical protein AXY04_13435 [Enterobacter asburiae]OZV01790.1 hypothetical protein CIW55_09590 [Enterobacter cloacae]
MSQIEQILTRSCSRNESPDELNKISSNSHDAFDGIMSGLSSMGNVIFWACDNADYDDKSAREDLRNIGEMLMYLPGIAAALKFNAGEADSVLREVRRKKN